MIMHRMVMAITIIHDEHCDHEHHHGHSHAHDHK